MTSHTHSIGSSSDDRPTRTRPHIGDPTRVGRNYMSSAAYDYDTHAAHTAKQTQQTGFVSA